MQHFFNKTNRWTANLHHAFGCTLEAAICNTAAGSSWQAFVALFHHSTAFLTHILLPFLTKSCGFFGNSAAPVFFLISKLSCRSEWQQWASLHSSWRSWVPSVRMAVDWLPQPSSRKWRGTEMSKISIAVEWGFEQIIKIFPFLDMRASMRVFKSPVSQCCINAGFLCNTHTCFCGNQTS